MKHENKDSGVSAASQPTALSSLRDEAPDGSSPSGLQSTDAAQLAMKGEPCDSPLASCSGSAMAADPALSAGLGGTQDAGEHGHAGSTSGFHPENASSSFTQGPWFVEGDGCVSAKLDDGPFVTIAMINPFNDVLVSEEAANAQLIALAPEMLAALRMCAVTIQHALGPSMDMFIDPQHTMRLSDLRALISRAPAQP